MSVKHLLAGTMVGVFVLALAFDPTTAEQGTAAAEQTAGPMCSQSTGDEKIAAERIAAGDAKNARAVADHSRASDRAKAAAKSDSRDPSHPTHWAQRLVFASGNKF